MTATLSNGGGRAVVLGAGVAGLAAAAALSAAGHEVTVVERDSVVDQPVARRGVPQSDQLHNVLGRAMQELEALLPGFRTALIEAGAVVSNVGLDTHIYDIGHHLPRRDLGIEIVSAWRPVIEFVARELLLAQHAPTIAAETRAVGFELDGNGRVTGVAVRTSTDRAEVLNADLVVDASGVNAQATRWAGRDIPTDSHTYNRWYASTPFTRVRGEGFWMIFPTAPNTRSGLVSPAGPDGWHVSVSGCENDDPPTDGAEVLAYAASLEVADIAELLDGCEATGAPRLFRRPVAHRYRYDLLDEPIDGLVVVGDAACSLNPLLGLGLSAAAWHASELRSLATGRTAGDLASIAGPFAAATARISDQAWNLTTLDHHPLVAAVLERRPGDPEPIRQAVAALIDDDPAVHRLDSAVWHLLEPAAKITTPELVDRVLSIIAATPPPHRSPTEFRP